MKLNEQLNKVKQNYLYLPQKMNINVDINKNFNNNNNKINNKNNKKITWSTAIMGEAWLRVVVECIVVIVIVIIVVIIYYIAVIIDVVGLEEGIYCCGGWFE